jgi:type III secretion protein R
VTPTRRRILLWLAFGWLVLSIPAALFGQDGDEPVGPIGGGDVGAEAGEGLEEREEQPIPQGEALPEAEGESAAGQGLSQPVVLVVVLAALSLVPFLLVMITSFVKLSVVGSIIRSALGTQQIPPTQVVTGLAMILTVLIMKPVGEQVYDRVRETLDEGNTVEMVSRASVDKLTQAMDQGKEPVINFLDRHAHKKEKILFHRLAIQVRPRSDVEGRRSVSQRDFFVIVPAFVVSELKEAFQIGFLIFVPFVVIDMVVSNILLAMGMMMLSPVTISLPIKLLLFVLVDGWSLITQGLVQTYPPPG